MLVTDPVKLAQNTLFILGTKLFLHHGDRIPNEGPVLVVSNHRSFMDALLLMVVAGRPIHFACHPYMEKVPILRELVRELRAFPVSKTSRKFSDFLHQATTLLHQGCMVGVFPEGGQPMVKLTKPSELGEFQRGFAHLAMRSTSPDLWVLPIAIAPLAETAISVIPLKLFHWADPEEPLFQQSGYHPIVFYHRVNVLVGKPYRVTPALRHMYQTGHAKQVVSQLVSHCWTEIHNLMQQGLV